MARPNQLPSVDTVAVCYHLAPVEFMRRLQTFASRSGRQLRGVTVCNHPQHALQSATGSPLFEVVRGSNSDLDFSGYLEGLRHLQAMGRDTASSNVLFVNDSLLTRHAAGAVLHQLLGLDRLLGALAVPAAAGKLDPYRSICLRNPWSHHSRYLTSFGLLLNEAALPSMASLPDQAEADGLGSNVSLTDQEWGGRLDPALREMIRAHLVHAHSPYRWSGAASADGAMLRRKARCVYFEHRLSGSIGKAGALVPINSGPRSSAELLIAETLARIGRTFTGGAR